MLRKNIQRFAFVAGLCAFLVQLAGCASTEVAPRSGKVVIGYVFEPDKPLNPDTIAADKLTHINYAFSKIEDGQLVEGFPFDGDNYRMLQQLKQRNPQLKILSSVGGWTWSGAFSDMALTEETRQRFIDSAAEFVRRHQLDGLDIDWEYPGLPGAGNTHRPEDGANFGVLLQALRERFNTLERELGRPLLLTIASGGFPQYLDNSAISSWHQYLDYINIMAYDYNFPADGAITGHHAALFSNPFGPTGMSADAAVRGHMQHGVPAHKIVLGVAFYGRQWDRVETFGNGLYQMGYAGDGRFGDNSYNNIAFNLVNQQGFVRYWDPISRAPWLWNAETGTFISYDDTQSVREKSKYVLDRNLAGIMFWQYTSDFGNQLLNTINRTLRPVTTERP